MRKIFIINTHYQIVFAIQLKLTLLKEDDVVLLISDHSKDSFIFGKEIDNIGIFSEVHFVSTKNKVQNYSKIDAVSDAFKELFFQYNNNYLFYFNDIENLLFDEFIFFNTYPDVFGIYSILYKYNKNIKCSRMEEGILSYNSDFCLSKLQKMTIRINKYLKRKILFDSLHFFYCFYPSLYNGRLCPVEVPIINKGDRCTKILKKVFNIEYIKQYKEKYIFFTTIFDFETENGIGEFELVKRVSELVGKENLLIKTHPRDYRTIYLDNGFKMDGSSSIPWEVIQLINSFNNNVFLTTLSSSVLMGNIISNNPVKTFYLYNLCNLRDNITQKSKKNIEDLLNNGKIKEKLQFAKAINNIEEIL